MIFIISIILLVIYLLIGVGAMIYTSAWTDEWEPLLILIWPKVMFFG